MDALLVAEDGKAGIAVKNHGNRVIEGTALFNVSGINGLGLALLQQAVEDFGVNYVECFGETLRAKYETLGFRVQESFKFDKSLAPQDWDYENLDEPKYHTMVLRKGK